MIFEKAFDGLSRAIPVRKQGFTPEQLSALSELNLLTAKPVLYAVNVDEDGLPADNVHVKRVREFAEAEGSGCIKISGKIEAEIAGLPEEERPEFLSNAGPYGAGPQFLGAGDLPGFGSGNVFYRRARRKPRLDRSLKTAPRRKRRGPVHTDFEKGFIKADIYTLEDLEQYKTEVALRAVGKIRSEGKDYIVKDGDIVFFKFNV